MMIEFEYNDYKAQFDEETGKLSCENPKIPSQLLVAKLNYIKRQKDTSKRTKLNVGCGFRPFTDCINLDYNKSVYPDIVRDVDRGLPFEDDRFEEVYTSHVIEHVKDIFFFVSEIWRVTKNKGKVKVIAPYCGFLDWAIQPDHLRLINYNFFERWQPDFCSVQDETKQIGNAQFNILKTELINEAREIAFELEVVKEEECISQERKK